MPENPAPGAIIRFPTHRTDDRKKHCQGKANNEQCSTKAKQHIQEVSQGITKPKIGSDEGGEYKCCTAVKRYPEGNRPDQRQPCNHDKKDQNPVLPPQLNKVRNPIFSN